MYSLICSLFLYCSKTIACFLCGIALHLSVCTVQLYRSPLQQCIVGWEEPPSKARAAMHSTTMAHWHQLHHNFITSSSLWIPLTLTFYRDRQHGARDAWQCQQLDPFRISPPFNSCSLHIVICWWSVMFAWTNGARVCEESPQLQWDYTERKGEGGIKKTTGWGDFKVAKCAGPCLNDGWRIVLISVPWGEHAREGVTLPLISAIGSRAPRERQKHSRNYGAGVADRLLHSHTAANARRSRAHAN